MHPAAVFQLEEINNKKTHNSSQDEQKSWSSKIRCEVCSSWPTNIIWEQFTSEIRLEVPFPTPVKPTGQMLVLRLFMSYHPPSNDLNDYFWSAMLNWSGRLIVTKEAVLFQSCELRKGQPCRWSIKIKKIKKQGHCSWWCASRWGGDHFESCTGDWRAYMQKKVFRRCNGEYIWGRPWIT